MTTTFDGRERGYENKFAHDQETEFKIAARMNHLLGLWAAEKILLSGDAAENYAQTLVEKVVQKDGVVCVKEQLRKDFGTAGLEISIIDIENEIAKLTLLARDQIINIG